MANKEIRNKWQSVHSHRVLDVSTSNDRDISDKKIIPKPDKKENQTPWKKFGKSEKFSRFNDNYKKDFVQFKSDGVNILISHGDVGDHDLDNKEVFGNVFFG